MRIENAISAYLTYCRVEGRTAKTVQWHDTSLNRLRAYLATQGIDDLNDVSVDALRQYVESLQTSQGRRTPLMSAHSVATYVRSLRAFFRWLHAEEYLTVNPATRVREPRTGESELEPLSTAEVRNLIDAAKASRDKAILLLLFDTGVRSSELCNATKDDFSEEPASLRVYGKGRKWRTVPIGRTTARAIRKYVKSRKDDSPYLFVARGGTALTANGLLQLLKRLDCDLYPHKLRHTFAITYLRNGGDLFSLQKILGHTSLEMVRHYARLAESDVSDKHQLYSPADLLRGKG